MCEQGDTTEVVLANADCVQVDSCIAQIVLCLNAGDIMTVASCCGHGNRPGNIALEDGRELVIAPNYEAGRAIDKMFANIQGEWSPIQNLVSAVSDLMICFPEFIKKGSIDEDFTLPYLKVDAVRDALKVVEGTQSE